MVGEAKELAHLPKLCALTQDSRCSMLGGIREEKWLELFHGPSRKQTVPIRIWLCQRSKVTKKFQEGPRLDTRRDLRNFASNICCWQANQRAPSRLNSIAGGCCGPLRQRCALSSLSSECIIPSARSAGQPELDSDAIPTAANCGAENAFPAKFNRNSFAQTPGRTDFKAPTSEP